MQPYSKLWYLSNIKLFADIPDKDMQEMENKALMHSKVKYEPIYLPGEPANSVYILKKGRIRISSISAEGKQVIHSILGPGHIFGELSLIDDDSEHESLAEAIDETLFCTFHKKDFEAFLQQHPQLNLKVTKLIGFRLKQITSRVQDLVFKSAEERVESVLNHLVEEHGQSHTKGRLINLPLTHQDLGDLTNLARPTVSEIMKRLQTEGKIQIEKRKIILVQS